MTGLLVTLAGGGLVGLGVALLVWRLVPAQPDLADALHRLAPDTTPGPPAAIPAVVGGGGRERLGRWAIRVLPAGVVSRPRPQDLAILRMSPARFVGEKVMFGLLGLAAPSLVSTILLAGGIAIPFAVPVAASLAVAAVLFWLPDWNLRDDAKRARAEFGRALAAYLDLVALERAAGSGTRQALEVAAQIGDSWVFRRLAEDLARSRWSGLAPWDALHGLASELGLSDLDDLADIMRLSGEEGAQIYATLRARSAGLRSAQLHHDLARANETNERLTLPMSLLGVIFMAILIAPALLRLILGAAPTA